MSNYGAYGPSSTHSCRPYCNKTGYYNDGFTCYRQYCCGTLNSRYCCNDSALDVSNSYPDKCHCPMSSCYSLSWDILLPCVAASVFVLLMVAICCCQGCRRGTRCRKWLHKRCLGIEADDAAEPDASAITMETGHGVGFDPSFPHLPPYQFGPPKYDSLELTEAPPKYEEAMRQQQQQQQQGSEQQEQQQRQHYDNSAFADDGSVTPDVTRHSDVTRDSDVTPHLDASHTGDSVTTGHWAESDCSISQGQGKGQGHIQGHGIRPTSAVLDSDKPCRFEKNDLESGSSSAPQTASSNRTLGTPGSVLPLGTPRTPPNPEDIGQTIA